MHAFGRLTTGACIGEHLWPSTTTVLVLTPPRQHFATLLANAAFGRLTTGACIGEHLRPSATTIAASSTLSSTLGFIGAAFGRLTTGACISEYLRRSSAPKALNALAQRTAVVAAFSRLTAGAS
jgi:hypothetical protein